MEYQEEGDQSRRSPSVATSKTLKVYNKFNNNHFLFYTRLFIMSLSIFNASYLLCGACLAIGAEL